MELLILMVEKKLPVLVGGFNPFEKYARQIGNLPQIGVKINNIWNHHLVNHTSDPPPKTGIP